MAGGIGGPHIDTAVPFAPIGSSFALDRVELAVNLLSGLNVLDVALTTSVGGFPGAVLETFHFVDAMGPFGLLNPPLIADSVLHSILSEGTQYWLVASAPDLSTSAAWNLNTTNDPGLQAQREDGEPWFLGSTPWSVSRQWHCNSRTLHPSRARLQPRWAGDHRVEAAPEVVTSLVVVAPVQM